MPKILVLVLSLLFLGSAHADMHSLYKVGIDENHRQVFQEVDSVEIGGLYAYHLFPKGSGDRENIVAVAASLPKEQHKDFDPQVLGFGWAPETIRDYLETVSVETGTYPGRENLLNWVNISEGSLLPGSFLGLKGARSETVFRFTSVENRSGSVENKWQPVRETAVRLYFAAGNTKAFFGWERVNDRWQILPIKVSHPDLVGTDKTTTAPATKVEQGRLYKVFYRPGQDDSKNYWHDHVPLESGSSVELLEATNWPGKWLMPKTGSVVPAYAFAGGGSDKEGAFALVDSANGTYWEPSGDRDLEVWDLYRSKAFEFDLEKTNWVLKTRKVVSRRSAPLSEDDKYIVLPSRRSPEFLPQRFYFGADAYQPPPGYKPVGGNWYKYDPTSIPKYWHPSGTYNP